MDSDLAESVAALQESLQRAGQPFSLARVSDARLVELKERYKLPRRYRRFLAECDPTELEVATPAERVQLVPSAELDAEQSGFAFGEDGRPISGVSDSGWRPSWIIIGRSGLLGDPYFLDTSNVDAEGDCPVYTAMSGTDVWQPKLCASTFALFLRILAINAEVAADFDLDDYDVDNERVFREALVGRIREHDPAAVKAGHWT